MIKTLMGKRAGGSGRTVLYMPKVSGNFADTPDAAYLEFPGDFELRAIIRPSQLTSAARILSKFNTTGNQRSFVYYFPGGTVGADPDSATDGLLQVSADGTLQAVGRSAGGGMLLTANIKIAVKATWRQSDGRVQHFFSYDYDPDANTGTWTQKGVDIFDMTAAAGRFDCSAALEMGSANAGTSSPFGGLYYRAQLYSGIDGTKVFDADFTRSRPGDLTVLDGVQGAVVTVHQSGANPAAIIAE